MVAIPIFAAKFRENEVKQNAKSKFKGNCNTRRNNHIYFCSNTYNYPIGDWPQVMAFVVNTIVADNYCAIHLH